MIKIMVGIQKGGVGKSTTVSIMAEILSTSGYKVLVLDLDSQGNATQMLTQKSIYEFSGQTVLEAVKDRNPNPYIVRIKDNLHLIPAEDMLSTFSRYIYTSRRGEHPARVLKDTMENLDEEYDFILLDCPPNVGDIVVNAISYADYIIIPVQLEPFSNDALDRFINIINDAREEGHTVADILGIVFTLVDKRTTIEKKIGEHIKERYGDLVFNSTIHNRTKLKEFSLFGIQMKKKSELDALEDYINLVEEMIDRVK